jgi:hypothetical protein
MTGTPELWGTDMHLQGRVVQRSKLRVACFILINLQERFFRCTAPSFSFFSDASLNRLQDRQERFFCCSSFFLFINRLPFLNKVTGTCTDGSIRRLNLVLCVIHDILTYQGL